MAENLTTLYLYKIQTGGSLTTTTNDAQIVSIINAVSASVASYCDRVFESTEYKEWYDGSGAVRMTLRNFPITNLKAVSLERDKVADITYTGGMLASVHTSGATMTLNYIDSAGDSDTEDITLSGSTDDVAALVNAVSGWTMTVATGEGSRPMILARIHDGGDALAPNSVELDVPGDLIEARLVSETNQQIEIPVFSSAFRRAIAKVSAGFSEGQGNVFVWYEAGYTLPAAVDANTAPSPAGNVPTDLTMIVNEIVREVFDGTSTDATMKSEKFTNYAYTKADTKAGAAIKDAVARYAQALTPYISSKLY